MTIRPPAPDDEAALTETLAQAFATDPVMAWIFPKRTLPRLRGFFRRDLRHRILARGVPMCTDDRDGLAGWMAPGKSVVPMAVQLRILPACWSLLGPRAAHALRFWHGIEAAHPAEEHWYLSHLAVRPSRQGAGLGSALLAVGLERADAEGLPAYLESSNDANLAFYGRHGFEAVGTITAKGGPHVVRMWRSAR